jgi:hypothetical protein
MTKITIERILLENALTAFETDDWAKKLQSAIDIRKVLQNTCPPTKVESDCVPVRVEGDCVQCGGDCPEFCCQVYMSGFGSYGIGNPFHPAAKKTQFVL